MHLAVDLSEQNAAALEAQARAAGMPAERNLAHIVARALEREHCPGHDHGRVGSRPSGSPDAGSAVS
jgi:hypothetical protein